MNTSTKELMGIQMPRLVPNDLCPPYISIDNHHAAKLAYIASIDLSKDDNYNKVIKSLQDECSNSNTPPDIKNMYQLILATINAMSQYKTSHNRKIEIDDICQHKKMINKQIMSFSLKKINDKGKMSMQNSLQLILNNAMKYINDNVITRVVQTERSEQNVKKEILFPKYVTTGGAGKIPEQVVKQNKENMKRMLEEDQHYRESLSPSSNNTESPKTPPHYIKPTTASRGWRKPIPQNGDQKLNNPKKFDATAYNANSHNQNIKEHNQVHFDKPINPVSSRQGGRFVYKPIVDNYLNNNHQQHQQGGNVSLATQIFANNTRFAHISSLTKKPTGFLPTI